MAAQDDYGIVGYVYMWNRDEMGSKFFLLFYTERNYRFIVG